ncbi:pentatricopeptide repeat domain 2 [Cricetulus griseus]
MKLKEFQQKKVATAHNLPSTKAIYFRSLEEKLTQNKLILKEELKTLLHLCQSREDVELAKSVIYRYHSENRNFTVGEYKFGPVFMRLCYELHLEDSAVELIKDKILIHVRSNMLENLIKILQDNIDRNVSLFVKRHMFSEEVLAKVREKLKDSPTLRAKFDEVYGKLHINGQVTICPLDAMLCHVPRDKKPNTLLLKKRTVSQRTLQPLSQSLLTE